MMFVTNVTMAITAILASLIGFIIMSLILKNSQKYFNEQQKQLGSLNGHIEEVYSGHNIVKVYNAMNEEEQEFDKINEELYKSNRKSQFLSGAYATNNEFHRKLWLRSSMCSRSTSSYEQ